MAVSRLAAAAWLSGAAVLGGAGFVAQQTFDSAASSSASQPSSPTLGGGTVQSNASSGNNGNGNGNGNSNSGHSINLSGAVVGKIGLGIPATLNVTIDNPNNQDIVVTSVTGSITSVTSAGLTGRPVCSASWFSVGTFTGSKTIVKNKSGVVSVPITLTNLASTNQDNCKGSTVQFSFSAQAQQA